MIQNSFIFLDKVGPGTEKRIWESGIHSWDRFLENKSIPRVQTIRKGFYDRQIQKANNAIKEYDSSYFQDILKSSDTFRLYDTFKNDVCFLDIETSGYYGDITVIGLYDGENTKTLVRGLNLSKETIKEAFIGSKLILTFNGASFDLPVIRRYFGDVIPKIPHIDLRHVCSKIGLNGGLKNIEKIMKIKRAQEVSDMDGADAIYLWRQYRSTGNKKFLDLLVQYNEEDIVNLQRVAQVSIKKLWQDQTLKYFNK